MNYDEITKITAERISDYMTEAVNTDLLNRPGFPGEYFICELRLPDHYFRWKHNKLSYPFFCFCRRNMAQPFQQSSIVIPVHPR